MIERAVLAGTIADVVQIRNIFTADVTEVGGDTSATLWEAYFFSLMPAIEDISFETVHYYQYEVQTYADGKWIPKDTVSIDNTGVFTEGDQLPNQTALVLIGKAQGLRKIGRKFFSGLAELFQDAGLVEVAYAASLAALLAAWITPVTGLTAGTLAPGILDKYTTFRPFVSGVVSSLLGSMRRRKPGLGI